MAAAQEWVIRVVQFEAGFPKRSTKQECSSMWLENLRYMGVINYHVRSEQIPDPTTPEEFLYKSIFDVYAPRHIGRTDSKSWAEQNSARMRSFGINAVAAPRWIPGQPAVA